MFPLVLSLTYTQSTISLFSSKELVEVTSVHYFWLFRWHERTGVLGYICALRTQMWQLMPASLFYADSFPVFLGNEVI